MPNYPDPEVWPDDDRDYELSKDELAREVLDGADLAEYLRQKKSRK